MENKSQEIEKPRDTVILILKENRFEVEKQKLIGKSQYFAALLSEKYSEYRQTEHIIKYDNILPISFQDFVDWIHNSKIDIFTTNCWDIRKCDRLSILIELSILFAVDDLIKYLIYKIEKNLHFMPPKYVINLWLLSQELNLNILRDVSLAFCLDRFGDLPFKSIYELSKENFLKLIGNINITSTKSYLLKVTKKWMDHHNDFTIPLDILKNKETQILHSIISGESSNSHRDKKFIHCWDGNNFFELTSFKFPKDIAGHTYPLQRMSIIGRRYNVYLCGGEFGFHTGIFNKDVWRYSLISKNWFLETVMPTVRTDMIAAFMKNKLILVGGLGDKFETKSSVDIYDIYTGLWTSGAKIPCKMRHVSNYSVLDEKLILCAGNATAKCSPEHIPETLRSTFTSDCEFFSK
ncbi:PREDICTED: uncharacterized protein LOC108762232 [Trachymyrmex cornetzi]|uniref:uncharacterized protein LOC108762232 n=1 Tax=Trachymyrmex cornetzi TaxID=471704 RepID=UPI00084F5725|nr:PREDICTED: uncharacterized protein LOC108762232 [Trachymyrmex cornetzi]